ncbi:MAG: aspartate/glutamate racemase family protein [Chloroflexi bacterium]|nr:aspartate/glutamate racemase family protein [Chloroflexota bacterium]
MNRIGVLYPSCGFLEHYIQKVLPEDVTMHVTRLPMATVRYEDVMRMADKVEEGAGLLADAKVGVIAFVCTAASFIKGAGYDQEIMKRITAATGIPASTMITAVIAGLRALNTRKLVLITPYIDRIVKIEKQFLENAGFEVLSYFGLGLDDADKQVAVEPSYWCKLAMERRHPEADTYLLSCGGIRGAVEFPDQLEKDLGKPVVTSLQAQAWHCLRLIGRQEPIEGFGRLLRTRLEP